MQWNSLLLALGTQVLTRPVAHTPKNLVASDLRGLNVDIQLNFSQCPTCCPLTKEKYSDFCTQSKQSGKCCFMSKLIFLESPICRLVLCIVKFSAKYRVLRGLSHAVGQSQAQKEQNL